MFGKRPGSLCSALGYFGVRVIEVMPRNSKATPTWPLGKNEPNITFRIKTAPGIAWNGMSRTRPTSQTPKPPGGIHCWHQLLESGALTGSKEAPGPSLSLWRGGEESLEKQFRKVWMQKCGEKLGFGSVPFV